MEKIIEREEIIEQDMGGASAHDAAALEVVAFLRLQDLLTQNHRVVPWLWSSSWQTFFYLYRQHINSTHIAGPSTTLKLNCTWT